jgi:transcriptional regulator with XRE-family HTH domain
MYLMHIQVKHKYASKPMSKSHGAEYDASVVKHQRKKTFLRQWRKQKPGRTLEQVAEHLHISQPQLGRIERGDQPYNQDLLEALAELYGCEVPDLLWRDPSDPQGIWTLWDHARPGERRIIVAAMDAILRSGTDG